MRAHIIAIASLLLTGFVSGCVETKENPAPSTSSQAPTPLVKGKTLTVTAQDVPPSTTPGKPYFFSPKTLNAQPNETINLVLQGASTNQLSHDLKFDTSPDPKFQGIGQVKTDKKNATFVALQQGVFKFYCSVGGSGPMGHRALGMEGTLIVGTQSMPSKNVTL